MKRKDSKKAKKATKRKPDTTRKSSARHIMTKNQAVMTISKGARVRLVRDIPPCRAGFEGVVNHVGQDGNLTVAITHNEHCHSIDELIFVSPNDVTLGSNCK